MHPDEAPPGGEPNRSDELQPQLTGFMSSQWRRRRLSVRTRVVIAVAVAGIGLLARLAIAGPSDSPRSLRDQGYTYGESKYTLSDTSDVCGKEAHRRFGDGDSSIEFQLGCLKAMTDAVSADVSSVVSPPP